jgi:acyl carrier protein
MSVDRAQVLGEIAGILHIVAHDVFPDETIDMDTRLRDDLGLESIDLVHFAERLQSLYGAQVNLALFLAELVAEEAADLRVGQVVDFIADALGTGHPRSERW